MSYLALIKSSLKPSGPSETKYRQYIQNLKLLERAETFKTLIQIPLITCRAFLPLSENVNSSLLTILNGLLKQILRDTFQKKYS